MNKSFSIYLDLVRFVAACLVYLYHSNQRWLVTEKLPASHFGHSSVVVFFVLSGYVIAYVTHEKERHWIDYVASRTSRLYSVALPAVFLTLLLDFVGRRFDPSIYAYPFDQFVLRSVASLALMNEWWFVSITSFSNVPYWSICYEGWYYVAFGAVMFLPRRSGLVVVAMLALFLGPKIVLLAPIWWAGVLLYRWKALATISTATAWVLVVLSCIGIVAFHVLNVETLSGALVESWFGATARKELTFSQSFPSDYLLGALVFMNFAGMRVVAPTLGRTLLVCERPIKFAASFTLTLYLLHQPLLLFWAAMVRGNPAGIGTWALVTALTASSVVLIGYFTENRRHGLKRDVVQRLRRLQVALEERRYGVRS